MWFILQVNTKLEEVPLWAWGIFRVNYKQLCSHKRSPHKTTEWYKVNYDLHKLKNMLLWLKYNLIF